LQHSPNAVLGTSLDPPEEVETSFFEIGVKKLLVFPDDCSSVLGEAELGQARGGSISKWGALKKVQ
jgi:hypothetical protein